MEGRLFEDLVVSRAGGAPARAAGIPFSLAMHGAGLAALLVLSVAMPEDLPATLGPIVDFPPGPVVVAAAPVPAGRPARRPVTRQSAPAPRVESAPSFVPSEDEVPAEDFFSVDEVPEVGPGCLGCAPTGGGGGSVTSVGDGTGTAPAGDLAPVRVGGQVQPPRKIRHVDPVYPDLARRAGVSGTVILFTTR